MVGGVAAIQTEPVGRRLLSVDIECQETPKTETRPRSRLNTSTILKILVFGWLPMLAWMAWIFYLSDQPSLPRPGRRVGISDSMFDYSAHMATFGFLAILIWRAIKTRPRFLPAWLTAQPKLTAGIIAALYAASDEIHQRFVPGRWAKFSDWAVDVVGIVGALLLIHFWELWRSSRQARKEGAG
jgi:VanZ family protein